MDVISKFPTSAIAGMTQTRLPPASGTISESLRQPDVDGFLKNCTNQCLCCNLTLHVRRLVLN